MKDTYMQEAYDALVENLKREISKQRRQNDIDMDANTNRETVLLDFIHQRMGKAGVLAAAALVDAHEQQRRNDPSYNYGMVAMVDARYPDNPKGEQK